MRSYMKIHVYAHLFHPSVSAEMQENSHFEETNLATVAVCGNGNLAV